MKGAVCEQRIILLYITSESCWLDAIYEARYILFPASLRYAASIRQM